MSVYYQIMRQLNLDTAFDDHMICADLENVIFFMDFSGIFDCGNSDKAALRQKKVEAMFSSEGIALDFGGGPHHDLPFERSSSMSRESRLSFIRADLYEPVRQRIMLSYMMTVCEEKTPRKKKKPARRPAGKTKQGMRSCTGSSRSLWKKAGGWRIITPPRRICAGSCARRPFLR